MSEQSALNKQRIVVKVGTSTITNEKGDTDIRALDLLCRTLSGIQNLGYEVVLVSSGAIAVGAGKMRLDKKPESLRMKQAAAAVGQCELMHLYDKLFSEYGKLTAQILLSNEDVEDPGKSHNLTNTFNALLENRIIPIVNENDSISSMEIESADKLFSDNDMLSAVVAIFTGAAKLAILSDIDGLYDKNPQTHDDAQLISRVESIDDTIRSIAEGTHSNRGRGGMITKLEAANLATSHGIDVLIMNGRKPEQLYDMVDHKVVGTLFVGR